MALIQWEINRPRVFTAKCSEPQAVISDDMGGGSYRNWPPKNGMRRKEKKQMISSYNKTTDHLNVDIEELIENIVTTCHYSDKYWNCTIERYRLHTGYMELTIRTEEKDLTVNVGENNQERWIEFPNLNLKGTISNLFDIFYNFQKIHELLNDPIDAVTVSSVLHECQNTIPFLWN